MLTHSLIRLLGAVWDMPFHLKIVAATAIFAAARRRWTQRQQRRLSAASKGWPTHRGRVVAAQALRDGNGDDKGKWLGLLTYSYILDEVEIGEYRQLFDSEEEVDEWVRRLRDKVVTVAVDPADKRRSIWLAEEAEAARRAAVTTPLDAETAELPMWLETVRLATLAVAAVGAVVSVAMELTELLALFAYAPAPNDRFPAVLSTAAFSCSGIAAYVVAKRFPGSSMGNIGKRFQEPLIDLFLKLLGMVEGTLFFGLWWKFGEGGGMMHGLTGSAVFSAMWGGLFAAAGAGLWVAGRRLPVQHELAPQSRGQMEI